MRRGSGWKQNFMDMPAGRQVRATYRSALIRSGHGAIGPIGGGLTGGVTIRSSARSGLAIEFLRSTVVPNPRKEAHANGPLVVAC